MLNIWTLMKPVQGVHFNFVAEFETVFHWVTWAGSIAYSQWVFSKAATRVSHSLYKQDFEDGWAILGRKKDVSDEEWAYTKIYFLQCWPWIFSQIFLSQVFFRKWNKWLPHFYAVFSLAFFVSWMGVKATLIYVICILVMCAVHRTGSRLLCYVVGLLMLYSLNLQHYMRLRIFAVQDSVQLFLFDIGLGWITARCISFSVDRINNRTFQCLSLNDICGILCYCLYQPTLFCGPLIAYDTFMQQLSESSKKWDMQRAHSVFTKFCRYLFSFICLEFCLHFLYSSALQFYPEAAYDFNSWALGGFGFSLCLTFYLKYKLIYGVAGFFAEIEGFNFPPPPKCICRIHLSSHQWRHFDRGLHLWLAKYIARPMSQHGRTAFLKILTVFLCFSFIFVWHGMGRAIGIWSYTSCFGVVIEYVGSEIASIESIQQISKKWPLWYRRVKAFFGAMAFIMMTISCIFFLSSMKGGMLFVHKILVNPVPLATTLFVLYCASHVSMDVAEYEAKTTEASHKTPLPDAKST